MISASQLTRSLFAAAGSFLFSAWAGAAVDTSYAVQASATVQLTPAQITLTWTTGPGATSSYALARKEAGATSWTPLIDLTGGITTYTDTTASPGRMYEYQIIRQSPTLTGYGYVAAGIDVPAEEARGRLILVIDNSIASAIAGEIGQLVRDLTGDGWTVARRDVGRGDSPTAVREVIRTAYNEDRANTRAVFLLGHVPVARSGQLNIDGHAARALPADGFYGDVDGAWTDANGDGVFDQDFIPSDVDLAVGRVDFADLGSFGSETDLLRRYLGKDHDFRHAIHRVTFRALVGDRNGDFDGESFGASGFRNFAALLGPGRITAANVEDNSPASERWITWLSVQDWLWVYGTGGGDVTAISGLGFRGLYGDVTSADLVERPARGTFYLLFGSWLVDWSQPDNIMRAALAAPGYGLTAAWCGRPHLFFHRMAMGETIGESMRRSQNNTTLYTNQVNKGTRGIHLALLGDPTLHLQVVAPPTALQASASSGPAALAWGASPDASEGYLVYRASSDAGPYTRVTTSAVTGTTFTDNTAPAGTWSYMVRAVRRETSGGGTYFNQSQGVFAQVTVPYPAVTPPTTTTPVTTPPVTTTPVTPPATATPPVTTPPPVATPPESSPPPPTPAATTTAPATANNSTRGGGGAVSTWMLGALTLLALGGARRATLRGRRGLV